MKELLYINKYFKKYKNRLLLGVLITILSKLFTVYVPKYIGNTINIIDAYIKSPNKNLETFKTDLLENILLIIIIAIATGVFTFLMRQTIIVVSRYIEFDLKNEIYQQYQRLSQNFYKQNRTGDLMNRISEDVSQVRMYVGPAIMYSINTITLFVVTLTFMYKTAPTLTLYTIIPLPILSFLIYGISKEVHKRSTVLQEYLSQLSTYTQETFSGISVIKAYGIEDQINEDFKTHSSGTKEKQLHLTLIQAFFFPMMILLIGVSNIIVIYIGGKQYINGEISLGTISEFIIYVNLLTWPVATVGWVTSIIQRAEASQKRINEFLKQVPEIKNEVSTLSNFNGEIKFNNVSYTYNDTNIEALKNISFKIEKGKTLVIIGKTGSGKSTILDLISRLISANKGDVLVDGTTTEKHNLYSLREAISYVPQDTFLFSDSIKNNIKFGKETATQVEVIEAAKLADVHKNIIEFKEEYNTILGERGITLSGGQKQRISIARAILKAPKILLLDDCLSAVDTETEKRILNNLNTINKNTTTIIVSHRVSTTKNADQIIILDKGEITESGTHEQLINSNGYYKELYKKQLSEKEM